MGISASKSPLERRNTVARRSQRRTIHNIKSKVDQVYQDIKKFKGTEEDDNFNSLLTEIDHLKIELMRKVKDLQPQVRNIYEVTLKKLNNCEGDLRTRLLDNQEKAKKKEEAEQEKARKKEEKNRDKNQQNAEHSTEIPVIKEDEPEIEEVEGEYAEIEANTLSASTEKRKTLEVKFVQIIPPGEDDEQPESQVGSSRIVSPEEKRKSILKVGIPVMPGVLMNEISSKSKKISEHYNHQNAVETSDEDLVTRVNDIVNNLQAMECQIADFVGRKNGTQYYRIRDQLNEYLIELNQMNSNDEFTIDQVKLCKSYVGSNMSFLEEKAVSNRRNDSTEDVFFPDNNNAPLSPVEAQKKLQKLTKTTAI